MDKFKESEQLNEVKTQ